MCLLLPPKKEPRIKGWAAIGASVVVGTMLVVIPGYLYGTPLLYGGQVIPIALTTAIAFLALGLGQIAAAGPDYFPLRPFVGSSARALLLRAFLPMTVIAVMATGVLYYVVPQYMHINQALLSALSGVLTAVLVSMVVMQTARRIGDVLDRAASERKEAAAILRRGRDELEILVRERTTELAAANEALQAEIAERGKAEEALRDSEVLYHSLVESLPLNIYRKDLTGRFTFGNQRFCETLGLSAEAFLDKTDYDFFPPELAEKYRQDDRKVMETGKVFETIEEHQKASGEKLYVHVLKTPVTDARG